MSGYLCDRCANVVEDHRGTCVCVPSFPREHRKVEWFDAGFDEEPASPYDTCERYEPRAEA